jgi:hypothetical protein
MRLGMLALVGGFCTVTGAWTSLNNAPFVTMTGGNGAGRLKYSHAASAGPAPIAVPAPGSQTFQIVRADLGPTMSLDKTRLQFGMTVVDPYYPYDLDVYRTGPQTVRLLQSGVGTVSWTATPNAPWITVSPASGTGPATLSIDVPFSWLVSWPGTVRGAVTLTLTGAGNTSVRIGVEATTTEYIAAAAPIGAFDTPIDGATGIAGSIAVSGWAIDDIGVKRVEVWRDPVSGEGTGRVFIGTAVLVEGARPDVAAAHPTLPRNTMAGWGYLLLTNFLPTRGNGTFTIYAMVTDVEGNTTTLGPKTITCANDASTRPFGAIDTPVEGEAVSGSNNINFGWVLANGDVKAAPPGGGMVQALIDGAVFAFPGGWTARQDLTAMFPAANYSGVAHALGVASFDTTTLTAGVHSMSWVVTANNGQQAGVGSRFFSVSNSALMSAHRSARPAVQESSAAQPRGASLRLDAPPLMEPPAGTASSRALVDEVNRAPLDRQGVAGRRGYDLNAPLQTYAVGVSGHATLWAEELDRIELQLGGPGYTGYMRVGDRLGPLPIGSTINAATGAFTWGVGVAFVHDYDLVFVRWEHGRAAGRQEVRISLSPKQSSRVGSQVVIDTPSAGATAGKPVDVGQPFVVAGWAVDPNADLGTGVDTLHVWAYPLSACGPREESEASSATARASGGGAPRAVSNACPPVFLGATVYGGARPDVAAILGERFQPSGYGLIVESLSPGTYDLAVFAWSTVRGAFAPAKVVRVTVLKR